MTAATPALDTALSLAFANIFGAIEIELPDKTVRLLDGSAAIMIDGQIFAGADDDYGVLESIDAIEDGLGDQAPSLSLTLLPSSGLAAASLLNPQAQGSRVRALFGAFVRETGAAIADPLVLFDGEIDQGSLTLGKGSRAIDYGAVSGFERFFENQEGVRLAPTFHKSIWPGETGLDNATGVGGAVYWGVEPPKGAISYAGGGAGWGGFGFGGGNPNVSMV